MKKRYVGLGIFLVAAFLTMAAARDAQWFKPISATVLGIIGNRGLQVGGSDAFCVSTDGDDSDCEFSVGADGVVTSVGTVENLAPATATLSVVSLSGGVISNYGQTVANTQTLPTCAANLSARVVIAAAGVGAFNLKAAAGDKIYLNGVALDDGDKATLAAPAVGDCFEVRSFKSGATTYDWIVTSIIGALTDGGA